MCKRSLRDCCGAILFNNALFVLLKTLLSNQASDRLRTSSFGKIIDFFFFSNCDKCVVRSSLYLDIIQRSESQMIGGRFNHS